jgi:hypothetical protein
LHLDLAGNAYAYVGDNRYERVPLSTLLELVLEPWWERLGASAEEVTSAWAAIERQAPLGSIW